MAAPLSTSSISSVVLGGLATHLGVGAGAEPTGELAADVELDVGVAHEKSLRIGVDRDELDALEPDLDHPVDGVDATSTDTHDLDDGQVVLRCCHGGCLSLLCCLLVQTDGVRRSGKCTRVTVCPSTLTLK
jgi:hypothetical protein